MEKVTILKVDVLYEGKRLDQVVAILLPELSRTRIQDGIDNGHITLNGRTAKKRDAVKQDDTIEVVEGQLKKEASAVLTSQDIPLEIIYEDDYYLAVNKPAGLVVHPGNGNHQGTLVNGLLYHCEELSPGSSPERPGIVHRLDKNTSGVIITAKNEQAHCALAELFAGRLLTKEYTGICIGSYPGENGTIDAAIGRSRNDPIRFRVVTQGKDAVTEYQLVSWKQGISLLRIFPKTGRTHQIRVHCAYKGFPIVADDLYGGHSAKVMNLQPIDRQFAKQLFSIFNRQALHARSLSLEHPFTKNRIQIVAPYPEDFRKAIALFGLEAGGLVVEDHSA